MARGPVAAVWSWGVLACVLAGCETAPPAQGPDGGVLKETPSADGTGADCGNGWVEPGETCDGDASESSCERLGFPEGVLTCSDDCQEYDTSMCVGIGQCQNGLVEPGEECDEGPEPADECDYGVQACELCSPSCTLVEGVSHWCGDGVVDEGIEACDGDDLGGRTCVERGYSGGEVLCGDRCQAVYTECEGAVCGDGFVQAGEQCDEGTQNRRECTRWDPICCLLDCTEGEYTPTEPPPEPAPDVAPQPPADASDTPGPGVVEIERTDAHDRRGCAVASDAGPGAAIGFFLVVALTGRRRHGTRRASRGARGGGPVSAQADVRGGRPMSVGGRRLR